MSYCASPCEGGKLASGMCTRCPGAQPESWDDNPHGFDFSDEEPTHPDASPMAEIMSELSEPIESVRSPGIPTPTSERPTRNFRRPNVRWREGLGDG